jgi:DNA-binding CsgD family transcriptional regulator
VKLGNRDGTCFQDFAERGSAMKNDAVEHLGRTGWSSSEIDGFAPMSMPNYLASLHNLTSIMRSLGTPAFYSSMMCWLETMIPSDFWFVVRYGAKNTTTVLQDAWQKNGGRSFYTGQLDPVFFALGNNEIRQVTSFSIMRDVFDIDPRCADFTENVMRITDELMILVPGPDGSCTAVLLDRETSRFSADEIFFAHNIYALLAEMMELHSGMPRQIQSPDRRLWSPLIEQKTGFAAEIEGFSKVYALTRREAEIVAFILQGYPSASIAKALGITQGSVKNHKVRLYRKLDITNERELFPLLLTV